MKKGIFLDRDGVLIQDKTYLHKTKDIVLINNVSKAILLLKSLQYELFLFTNQSGINRGYYTLKKVKQCNDFMIKLMNIKKYYNNIFTDTCIATEKPNEKIIYRKPSPKFIIEMINKYNLNKTKCWMVGDQITDILAGLNAQINSSLIYNNKYKLSKLSFKIIHKNNIIKFHNLYSFAIYLKKINNN